MSAKNVNQEQVQTSFFFSFSRCLGALIFLEYGICSAIVENRNDTYIKIFEPLPTYNHHSYSSLTLLLTTFSSTPLITSTIPLLQVADSDCHNTMSSVSVLSTASLRTATHPNAYLHLIARSYSGVAVAKLRNSHAIQTYNSRVPYTSKRSISSTHQNQIKEYFPPPQTPGVKEVTTAWAHPV